MSDTFEEKEYNFDIETLEEELKEIDERFKKNYKVKVMPGRLKCFSGPGTTYVFMELVKKGDVLTIIEESSGLGALKWGLIEETKNWVSLDHCEVI